MGGGLVSVSAGAYFLYCFVNSLLVIYLQGHRQVHVGEAPPNFWHFYEGYRS